MEEQTLIKRCQSGDMAAFEILLGNYEKLIYNLCYRYFGNQYDASDVGQEAMVRVFRKIKEFNGKSSFKTWLYRVVTNLCLDELRRRKTKTISLDEIKEQGYEPITNYHNPEEAAESLEKYAIIQEVLLTLSREHRTILILKDVEGLEYNEIAQILDCSLGTVKSRLNRAREAFRKRLAVEPRYSILRERSVQA
ncbi:MAG TPA: sigma-70 family RNA polymerase sigma factor [Bacillota bacterium]